MSRSFCKRQVHATKLQTAAIDHDSRAWGKPNVEVVFFSLTLIDLAVALATILGVGMLVPQVLDMARTNNFRGVSLSWIGGGVAINGGWLAYALAANLRGLLPVSIGAIVLYLAMLVMMSRESSAMLRRSMVSGAAVVSLFAISGLVGGVAALGLVIALTYSAQFAPAAWSALFAEDSSGVSAPTWVMACIEAAIWAVYGFTRGDTALFVGGIGAGCMSLLVLVGLSGVASEKPDAALAAR